MGSTWQYEHHIKLGSDAREPHFLIVQNQLIFSFFQAGTDPIAFEPKLLLRTFRFEVPSWFN